MALSRLALKKLQQRACHTHTAPTRCKNYSLPPCFSNNYYVGAVKVNNGVGLSGAQAQGWSYGLLQRYSSSASSDVKDVAVQSDDQGGSSRKIISSKWRSLLPRSLRRPSLWRRKDNRDPFEPFPAASLGNALLEAAENMNRLFENMVPTQIAAPSQLIGKFKETEDNYKLRYDVPGLTKDDVKVTVDDGVLRVRGERKVEEENESEDEYWMSYGYYNTSLALPDDAKQDEIMAELKDGVLCITIPKARSHAKDVKEVKIM